MQDANRYNPAVSGGGNDPMHDNQVDLSGTPAGPPLGWPASLQSGPADGFPSGQVALNGLY
jgi:hypothetical protein